MRITIEGTPIGVGYPPYIIAELSANHNGSIEHALETITAAKAAGVNAIKLQTYTADTMAIDCSREEYIIKGGNWDGYRLYNLYRRAETPYEWHKPLFEHSRRLGLTIFSTPFDETAVDLLENLNAPAYKIASFEIIDLALIRYAAATKKPLIISTGMASEDEIGEAVDVAFSAGCSDLVLLHCISSYPAPLQQANLRQIGELHKRFKVPVGLSDHTLGPTAAVVAVAFGACIIEKHFTLDSKDGGPDSPFSLEQDEMTNLCMDVRDAWVSLGTANYVRPPCEEGSIIFRRSLIFAKNLAAGSIIAPGDIRRLRPGMGLAPKFYDKLIGKRLRFAVEMGEPTSWDHFDI